MSGYDYGNARLRAMRSRLLTRATLEDLARRATLQSLLNALSDTPYHRAVETAMAHAGGLDAVLEALQVDLVNTLSKVRRFYEGRERELVALVLRAFDLHNLKTVLRGLSHPVPPEEITRALLTSPGSGDLTPGTLADLVRASSPREAIDRLATLRLPLAQPLLAWREAHPGAALWELELALERWHDRTLRDHLQAAPPGAGVLAVALDVDADVTNLLTALRFTHAPAERRRLRQEVGMAPAELFVGPGRLSFDRLTQLAEQDSVRAAVGILEGTPYAGPLDEALPRYEENERLSTIEAALQRFRLRQRAALIQKDPLGIGVLLGYLALKVNEIRNLRQIALGIHLGWRSTEINDTLEFPS